MNLNDTVEVILTEYGKSVVDEYIRKLEAGYQTNFKELYKYDENGKFSEQLWVLMDLFGNHMYMGSTQVFKDNEITLLKK